MKNKIILFLIFIAIAINLVSFKNGHNWGDDFAAYIIQSQTIIQGSFEKLRYHSLRTDFILNYPWGYPILLTPVIAFIQDQLIILKLYTFCFFLASLFIVYYLFNERKEVALLTILFLSVNPFIWEFKNSVLSEFPNMFFTLLSILILNIYFIRKELIINDLITNIIIGLSIYLCFIIRTQSIMLLLTLSIVQIIVYRKRILKLNILKFTFVPYITFFFLKYFFESILGFKASSYIDSGSFNIIGMLNTFKENVFYYINIWSDLFSDISVISHFNEVFTGLVISVILVGLINQGAKNYIYIIYTITTLAVLCVWPYQQGLRFVLTIIPLFFYLFIVGLRIITTKIEHGSKVFYLSIAILTILSLKTVIVFSYLNYRTSETMEGPYLRTSQEMFNFICESSHEENIIGFYKPRAMLLYGKRDAVIPATIQDCLEKKVDYFVYHKKGHNQVNSDTVKVHPEVFSRVFSNEDFEIFRVNH